MPNSLQFFLANAADKAATDLEAALLRVPEDKRLFSAGGDARSAGDVVAECAILNGSTAHAIEMRSFPTGRVNSVVAREYSPRCRRYSRRSRRGFGKRRANALGTNDAYTTHVLPLLEHELSRRPNQLHRIST
jgi:hypothetical protein